MKYLIKGGKFQTKWNYHREVMLNGKGKNLKAKQQAFEIIWHMLERKIVFMSIGMIKDGEMTKEWIKNFAFLKSYGLPNLPNVYRGLINDEHYSTWIDGIAITIDYLLINNDNREIEYINKNEFKIKQDILTGRGINQGRIF